MFRITRQQRETLDAHATDAFRARLVEFLASELPEAGRLPRERLRQIVGVTEARAAAYGVRSEQGIAQFAFLSVAYGRPADELQQIREGLERAPDAEAFLELLVDALA